MPTTRFQPQIDFEDATLVPDRAFSLGVGSGISPITLSQRRLRNPNAQVSRVLQQTVMHLQFIHRHFTLSVGITDIVRNQVTGNGVLPMKFRTLVAGLLFSLALSANAQFQTMQLAHEVPLNQFVVPVTQNGTLNFRSCSDCQSFSSRLTPQTRFTVNGNAVQLSDFRNAVQNVRNKSTKTVTIVQHLDSNTITLISIAI